MQILTYEDTSSMVLIRHNVDDDTFTFISKDGSEYTYTALDLDTLANKMKELSAKSRYFQGLKEKSV